MNRNNLEEEDLLELCFFLIVVSGLFVSIVSRNSVKFLQNSAFFLEERKDLN